MQVPDWRARAESDRRTLLARAAGRRRRRSWPRYRLKVRAMGTGPGREAGRPARRRASLDRKSTRLNSSHLVISYADLCLKKNGNPNKNEAAALSQFVRRRMAHDSVKRLCLSTLAADAGVKSGKLRFYFFICYIAQKLLFPLSLERKPVS